MRLTSNADTSKENSPTESETARPRTSPVPHATTSTPESGWLNESTTRPVTWAAATEGTASAAAAAQATRDGLSKIRRVLTRVSAALMMSFNVDGLRFPEYMRWIIAVPHRGWAAVRAGIGESVWECSLIPLGWRTGGGCGERGWASLGIEFGEG